MTLFKCGTCHSAYDDYYPPDDTCTKCHRGCIRITTPQEEETTMTAIRPTIRRMTFDEASKAGLHSRGLMLEHQGKSYRLSAGTSDTITVFSRSVVIYVMTVNSGLGYIGLDAYVPNEPDPINTIFLHTEQGMKDVLGDNWGQLSAKTIALKLTNCLI